MNPFDGRLVSNFIVAALKGEDIEVYGDGSQTRSLMYVHDLVSGLIALMESDYADPVNIGTEDELTVAEWATIVNDLVDDMRRSGEVDNLYKDRPITKSKVVFKSAVTDDPPRRRPDSSRAKQQLGWEPKWPAVEGIKETIRYFAGQLDEL